jgi:hypothetical protein
MNGLEPERWKALWVALRRSPRDPHARRRVLRILSSLLVIPLWLGWYVFFFHGFISEQGLSGIFVVLFSVLFVVLLSFLIAFKRRRDDRAEELSDPAVAPELKVSLFRETVLLGTLLDRRASEIAMEKELPPEITVIARRVLLDRLQHHGLRGDLEPSLLDLLLAPDGHWTPGQKENTGHAWEYFEVLFWVLGLGELRSLTSEPRYSLHDIETLCAIASAEQIHVLASWDIRPARDAALRFLNRCWAELLARKMVSGASSDDMARALEMRSDLQEKGYTSDYLVGARTISELEPSLLFVMCARAWRRWSLLSVLVAIAAGESPATALRAFLVEHFSTQDAIESYKTVEPA